MFDVGQYTFDVFNSLLSYYGIGKGDSQVTNLILGERIYGGGLSVWQKKRLITDYSFIILSAGVKYPGRLYRSVKPRKKWVDLMKGLQKTDTICNRINEIKAGKIYLSADFEKLKSLGEDNAALRAIEKIEAIRKHVGEKNKFLSSKSNCKKSLIKDINKTKRYSDDLKKCVLTPMRDDFKVSKTYEESFPNLFKNIKLPTKPVVGVDQKTYVDALIGGNNYDKSLCDVDCIKTGILKMIKKRASMRIGRERLDFLSSCANLKKEMEAPVLESKREVNRANKLFKKDKVDEKTKKEASSSYIFHKNRFDVLNEIIEEVESLNAACDDDAVEYDKIVGVIGCLVNRYKHKVSSGKSLKNVNNKIISHRKAEIKKRCEVPEICWSYEQSKDIECNDEMKEIKVSSIDCQKKLEKVNQKRKKQLANGKKNAEKRKNKSDSKLVKYLGGSNPLGLKFKKDEVDFIKVAKAKNAVLKQSVKNLIKRPERILHYGFKTLKKVIIDLNPENKKIIKEMEEEVRKENEIVLCGKSIKEILDERLSKWTILPDY